MASKAQKRAKTRAARREQQDRRLAKQRVEVEELQDEEVLEEEIPVEEAEPVQKDMGEMMSYMGPTSWEEEDAMQAAREQANMIRETTWKTQDLVYNILGHPELDPKEKVARMKKVADGFEERVVAMGNEKMVKKDLDILVVEAILAEDQRHMSFTDRIGELVFKAKLTAAAEDKLSDEQFALVVTRDGKKVRKYPIHDKAHVRNALARAAQMMAEGGEAATDAKAAMPKIRAAAKKMGIEMSMEKNRNSIMIEKDLNGEWRYVGIPTNNFIDYDTDIIAKEAHAEYAAWWEEHKEFSPLFTTWHLPGMVRKNAADMVLEHDGFLIVSGTLTEEEVEPLLKAKALTDIGMSHQSIALARDPRDERVILKYRMYEFSDLPLENAANPFTNLQVLTKEADMDKEKYLAQFLGAEKAKDFLTAISVKKEALEEAGIESKEKPAETPAEPAQPEAPVAQPAQLTGEQVEAIAKALGMEELSEQFKGLLELKEQVPLLEAVVKELMEKNSQLQKSSDEKLAEMIDPPAARFSWMENKRASKSEKTVVKEENAEDQKLIKSVPVISDHWLSEATGTEPVQLQ